MPAVQPDAPSVPFSKYSGAGNDFAIVAAADTGSLEPAALARCLCPRSTGVGVDGLIIVESREPERVAARFFNPDGSEFSTCGNGTRCVALFARWRGFVAGATVAIETAGGVVQAHVHGDRVALDFEMEIWVERPLSVPWAGALAGGWLVQVGTPHLVLPIDRMPEGEIEPLVRPIRFDPALGPAGANVDLIVRRNRSEVEIRTYERGVEGETLACGSGAMATALALHAAGITDPALTLITRSGAPLHVSLPDAGNEVAEAGQRRRVRLEGPARRVFDGAYPRARLAQCGTPAPVPPADREHVADEG